MNDMNLTLDKECLLCNANDHQFLAKFNEKPQGETDFKFEPYYRELWLCGGCGHIINSHQFDMSVIYQGAYWDNTYADKIKVTFDKIMNLPPAQSDNRQRVKSLNQYYQNNINKKFGKLLDIGSGLAVFPAAMRQAGWNATALDPDPRACAHAKAAAKVKGLSIDILTMDDRIKYDLISLNKVLEHVPDMVEILSKTKDFLTNDGIVYIELPDGEVAIKDSTHRQEFFIEHYCAFSMRSLKLLIKKSDFEILHMERLIEPSKKYTIRAIIKPLAIKT